MKKKRRLDYGEIWCCEYRYVCFEGCVFIVWMLVFGFIIGYGDIVGVLMFVLVGGLF